MGSGQSLGFDVKRVRHVWSKQLGLDQSYLHQVFECAVNNKQLGRVFLPNDGHVDSAAEIGFILDNLAENMHEFFQQLLTHQLKFDDFYDLCYSCGKRHAAFSNETFIEDYWKVFELAFAEVAEKRINEKHHKDLMAWNSFIVKVIEFMREGYDEGRRTQKGDKVDIQDD